MFAKHLPHGRQLLFTGLLCVSLLLLTPSVTDRIVALNDTVDSGDNVTGQQIVTQPATFSLPSDFNQLAIQKTAYLVNNTDQPVNFSLQISVPVEDTQLASTWHCQMIVINQVGARRRIFNGLVSQLDTVPSAVFAPGERRDYLIRMTANKREAVGDQFLNVRFNWAVVLT